MDQTFLILSSLIGYCFGSIPFGLMIAFVAGQGDVREIGSGNIGATNVLRTGRKDLAALTLALDAGKAALAVYLVHEVVGAPYSLIAGGMALIGHCFPIWLGFKGGKGVATFFGALLATAWPIALSAAAVWIAVAFLTRLSSLAALCAAGLAPLIAFVTDRVDIAVMAAAMAVLIFFQHRQNIGRILKGEESRIGQKSNGSA